MNLKYPWANGATYIQRSAAASFYQPDMWEKKLITWEKCLQVFNLYVAPASKDEETNGGGGKKCFPSHCEESYWHVQADGSFDAQKLSLRWFNATKSWQKCCWTFWNTFVIYLSIPPRLEWWQSRPILINKWTNKCQWREKQMMK